MGFGTNVRPTTVNVVGEGRNVGGVGIKIPSDGTMEGGMMLKFTDGGLEQGTGSASLGGTLVAVGPPVHVHNVEHRASFAGKQTDLDAAGV